MCSRRCKGFLHHRGTEDTEGPCESGLLVISAKAGKGSQLPAGTTKDCFSVISVSPWLNSLDAQLRAVRRLRKGDAGASRPSRKAGLSQIDMAYDVLKKARAPLHVSDLLARIKTSFSVAVDRESLVSSLSKKVARGDRFLRTAKNTFGLRPEAR